MASPPGVSKDKRVERVRLEHVHTGCAETMQMCRLEPDTVFGWNAVRPRFQVHHAVVRVHVAVAGVVCHSLASTHFNGTRLVGVRHAEPIPVQAISLTWRRRWLIASLPRNCAARTTVSAFNTQHRLR